MGYNTRRVSLSLPSLGIQLPGSNAAARANANNAHHRSAPTSTATTPSAAISKSSSDAHPAKRVKRSHTLTTIPSAPSRTSLPSRPRKSLSSISVQAIQNAQRPPSPLRQQQHQQLEQQPQPKQQLQLQQQLQQESRRPSLLGTPPPSPRNADSVKLDTSGINDDIVVAVLEQLESTGNRPHLIKELVAVLITTLPSVESSQNPTAIISSRLTNYLKRPWTALAPCPLAKEQVTVHPRRVYYFLTNMPRQEIPEYADTRMANRHVISPSVSSGPDEEEEEMQFRMAAERSPSPEVDFPSLYDIGHPNSHLGDMFNNELAEEAEVPRERRLASPPLEHDEREFTQTATVLQLRKQSEQAEQQQLLIQNQLEQTSLEEATSKPDNESTFEPSFQTSFAATRGRGGEDEPSAEETALRNQDAAALLFGQSHHHLLLQSPDLSSPLMRPQQTTFASLSMPPSTPKKPSSVVEMGGLGADMDVSDSTMLDAFGGWADFKSPENVELAELDDMFGGF